MPPIHWIETNLSKHIPHLDLTKGADLDGNGRIESSERTDLNGDGDVDAAEWQKFLGNNKAALKRLGGHFKYYYTAGKAFKPDNPIHDLLSIESNMASPDSIKKAYSKVEKILDFVRKGLPSATTPQKKLIRVYYAMQQNGIKFEIQSKALFVDNINRDVLDCNTSSYAVLAVAHELGWPVHLVTAPNHAFVRWDDNAGTRFNVDYGLIFTDEYYLAKFNISQEVIKRCKEDRQKCVYLKNLNYRETISEFYYNRGGAKLKLGRYKEAIRDFDKTIRLNSNNTEAYNNRGVAKEELGRYEEAIKDYDQSIRLDPNNAAAYNNRGNAKFKLGRYKEAMKDYDEAIRLDPYNATTHNNRAVLEKVLARVGHLLIKNGPLWRYNNGDGNGGYQISAGLDLKLNFPSDESNGFAVGLMPEFAVAFTFIDRDDEDSWLTLMPNASLSLEHYRNSDPGKSVPYRVKLAGGYAGRVMPIMDDDEYVHGWTASAQLLFSLDKYRYESFASNGFIGPSTSVFHFPKEKDFFLNTGVQYQW